MSVQTYKKSKHKDKLFSKNLQYGLNWNRPALVTKEEQLAQVKLKKYTQVVPDPNDDSDKYINLSIRKHIRGATREGKTLMAENTEIVKQATCRKPEHKYRRWIFWTRKRRVRGGKKGAQILTSSLEKWGKVKRLPARKVLRAAGPKLRSTAGTDTEGVEGGNNHAAVRRNLHLHRSAPACHIAEASQPASRRAGRQAFTNSLPTNNSMSTSTLRRWLHRLAPHRDTNVQVGAAWLVDVVR